ncbi:Uncharacterized protein BP5553_02451 [Venustampulla echinocandica]|uniref:Xylanolytic transcriptional activator regulatory domain-containing protein n=1 Tax=Venustampulla echinocandica TaxID=2656787 RepID=A0A370U3Y0_9HELO|nr:Uncharacterized protein BP5553_02451 [Venustampulla echinocandica]RDL42472.1 Uncharacterized protein BP5553_02451 [Venustampulla echinocandica]
MQGHEDLNLLENQSLPEIYLHVGLQSQGGAFQNGILNQNIPGLDQSPNSSHSADKSNPVRDPIPFSPFNLDSYGQNSEWLFQEPRDPAADAAIQGIQFDNTEGSLHSQSSHDALFDIQIPQPSSISAQTHSNILSFISLEDVDSNPVATIEDTRRILDIAMTYLETCLPMFHQPTLSLDFVASELSASFLSIGLLICGDLNAHEIGCVLLQRLRGDLLQLAQNITIKKEHLWVLQSMLLVEFAGMFHANRSAMELSDIFHGTLVTLARRLGLFEPDYEPVRPTPKRSMDRRWGEWVQKETVKRLAYFIFVIDVQHSLLFGHDRSIISVFTLKLDLPCDEKEWRALTFYEWSSYTATSTSRRLKFHEIHQLLLSAPDIHHKLPSLDALSAYLVLSGFASITCDSLRRRHEPFFDRDQATNKLRTLLKAIADQILTTAEAGPVKKHGLTTYYISLISLGTQLDDLERAANSGFSLTGLTPKQQTRAAMARLLTRNKVGPNTAMHGVQLLRIYMSESHTSVMPLETSALYLGALTLWAYTIGRADDYESLDIASEISGQDSLAEMETAITGTCANACVKAWRAISRHVFERLASLQNDNAREYSEVLRGLEDFTV